MEDVYEFTVIGNQSPILYCNILAFLLKYNLPSLLQKPVAESEPPKPRIFTDEEHPSTAPQMKDKA